MTAPHFHDGIAATLEDVFTDGNEHYIVDLGVCQQGLQFFPDHSTDLNEIRRVLAVGGRVVLSVWRDLERQPFTIRLVVKDGAFLEGAAP